MMEEKKSSARERLRGGKGVRKKKMKKKKKGKVLDSGKILKTSDIFLKVGNLVSQ